MAGAIDVVGYVGSAGAAVMWVPQAVRAVRLRISGLPIRGISATSYAVAMVFNALLAWYGATEHAVPVVCAGVVNLLCASVIVVALSRRRGAS